MAKINEIANPNGCNTMKLKTTVDIENKEKILKYSNAAIDPKQASMIINESKLVPYFRFRQAANCELNQTINTKLSTNLKAVRPS